MIRSVFARADVVYTNVGKTTTGASQGKGGPPKTGKGETGKKKMKEEEEGTER